MAQDRCSTPIGLVLTAVGIVAVAGFEHHDFSKKGQALREVVMKHYVKPHNVANIEKKYQESLDVLRADHTIVNAYRAQKLAGRNLCTIVLGGLDSINPLPDDELKSGLNSFVYNSNDYLFQLNQVSEAPEFTDYFRSVMDWRMNTANAILEYGLNSREVKNMQLLHMAQTASKEYQNKVSELSRVWLRDHMELGSVDTEAFIQERELLLATTNQYTDTLLFEIGIDQIRQHRKQDSR